MYPLDKIRAPASPRDSTLPPAAWFTTPPHWGIDEQGQRESIRAYYASISFLDANVGRLLDALQRLGLTDNTIVVFISDHGYHLGEQGQWMKQTLFERSARAPLIVAAPGISSRGRSTSRIVEFLDVYPTLAELASVPAPDGLHGRSLVPLLKNPSAKWDHPALTQVRRGPAESTYMGYSIRTEKWRYTEWENGKRGVELYDEAADPRELKNIAADPKHSKVIVEMQALLRRVRRPAAACAGRARRAGCRMASDQQEPFAVPACDVACEHARACVDIAPTQQCGAARRRSAVCCRHAHEPGASADAPTQHRLDLERGHEPQAGRVR